ncbi:MAG: porphobilinogen synthase, partial [Pseudomonadota bacterium]
PHDFIWPMFVHDHKEPTSITTMPDIYRQGLDDIKRNADLAMSLQIPALAVFPIIEGSKKDAHGSHCLDPENIIQRTIQSLRAHVRDSLSIICDVALDCYTDHGHDGILIDGKIENDQSVDQLIKQALLLADAGADTLAPSDMMDGRVLRIREALDQNGFTDVRILSYAAKYASCFYGPFRDALGKRNALVGDKKTYQMDPANSDEALRETALDIGEGADMVMVKPAGSYLDIIRRVSDEFPVPVCAYQVSGEYAMIAFAAQNGAFDLKTGFMESLLAIKRAGADAIISYFAPQAVACITQQD